MTPKITVYSKPSCVQCDATYRVLDKAGTAYESVDITKDPEALTLIQGLGYLQAPVVIVQEKGKDDHHWSGFRYDKLSGYTVKGAAA